MATPKKTTKKVSSTRLYVNVAPQTMKRLDKIAERYGVTRSSLISMILGQYCESTERAFEAIPDAMKTALAMAAQSPDTQTPARWPTLYLVRTKAPTELITQGSPRTVPCRPFVGSRAVVGLCLVAQFLLFAQAPSA